MPFTYDDDVVKLIVSRCTELESGGRMIDAILTNTVLPQISREFLTRTMAGAALTGVTLWRWRTATSRIGSTDHGDEHGTAVGCARVHRARSASTRRLSIALLFQRNGQLTEAEEVYRKILRCRTRSS